MANSFLICQVVSNVNTRTDSSISVQKVFNQSRRTNSFTTRIKITKSGWWSGSFLKLFSNGRNFKKFCETYITFKEKKLSD